MISNHFHHFPKFQMLNYRYIKQQAAKHFLDVYFLILLLHIYFSIYQVTNYCVWSYNLTCWIELHEIWKNYILNRNWAYWGYQVLYHWGIFHEAVESRIEVHLKIGSNIALKNYCRCSRNETKRKWVIKISSALHGK